MSKKQLRITIDNQLIVAPIFDIEGMSWKDVELGCPYCKLYSHIKPKIDVIQFGLMGEDTIYTVVQCDYCKKLYALKYTNTQEVVE